MVCLPAYRESPGTIVSCRDHITGKAQTVHAMHKEDIRYKAYIDILKEELIPAMGCTEPIAIAYAAARLRELLGDVPQEIRAVISGSIIKNVKSVIVPNTAHQKGIETAIAAGIIAGRAEKKLEVIADVPAREAERIRAYREEVPIQVSCSDSGLVFDILLSARCGSNTARVRIANHHTNIVLEEKNGTVLFEQPLTQNDADNLTDRSLLSMEGIWDFSTSVAIADVQEILDRQIRCNTRISEEGLNRDYGANIGKVLLKSFGDSVSNRAKAAAAAGSDARMNGCELPVIINSGSGNQGITASVPVITYARDLQASPEKLYRALCISNLTSIHQKTRIGRLSAYCGAVNAGAGAGCGIAYLLGGDFEAIKHTLVNALAIVSGMICDGAKASCAAKIAAAVDAGILGCVMYQNGQQFFAGDGIVGRGVEQNIVNIGRLGKDGMGHTNDEIISIMIGQ